MNAQRHTTIVCGIAMIGAATTAASAGTSVFKLFDHPDGNQNPPPYGLRLDNIFHHDNTDGDDYALNANADGATTFTFDTAAGVFLTVTDVDNNGVAEKVQITGTVYGGVDTNPGGSDDYGFGEGYYAIDFTWLSTHVAGNDDGWEVAFDGTNIAAGTIEALGANDGVSIGETWNFFMENSGMNFEFERDGHRLDGGEITALGDPWVGRGWHTYNSDGSKLNDGDSHDWLFYGQLIPLPSGAGLAMVGLAAIGIRRRR